MKSSDRQTTSLPLPDYKNEMLVTIAVEMRNGGKPMEEKLKQMKNQMITFVSWDHFPSSEKYDGVKCYSTKAVFAKKIFQING